MIPSYIGKPSGQEKGEVYALDLGGTNFRVIQLTLHGNGQVGKQVKAEYKIQPDIMNGNANDLFDFIADCLSQFLKQEVNVINSSDKIVRSPLGFTFSFPVKQTSLNSGTLIKWTKGFTTKGVEGKDVVDLLNKSLLKKHINIEVVALANDTVGTLMTESYGDNNCEMGVILGTGSNACYLEKFENIRKINKEVIEKTKGKEGMIINMEWGAFGDGKNILKLTNADKLVDKFSVNPGFQLFEKMISGMYLGEITRYVLLQVIQSKQLFNGNHSNELKEQYSFQSSYLSEIENDTTVNLEIIDKILNKIGIKDSTLSDRHLIRKLGHLIVGRAAKLSGCAIAGVLSKLNRLDNVTVAVDGSVFEHYPGFNILMSKTIKELYPQSNVKLVLTKDGSGIGAAVIAATASY